MRNRTTQLFYNEQGTVAAGYAVLDGIVQSIGQG